MTGGEDDLVQVWSMEDRKIVAWGEGHNSWVSLMTISSSTLIKWSTFSNKLIARLAELLLIPIGLHQILMEQETILCIASVLLAR